MHLTAVVLVVPTSGYLFMPGAVYDHHKPAHAPEFSLAGRFYPPSLPSVKRNMKSAGAADGGLFTESYCNICNAQLISESQRIAHYESKKHANKVRLFYMLHPEDGGPPSKRLRPDNADSDENAVDQNKCCTLCNIHRRPVPLPGQDARQAGKGTPNSPASHPRRVKKHMILVMGSLTVQIMTSHIPVLFPPCLADCAPGTPQPVDLALAPAPLPPPLVPPSWPLLANGEAGKYCCLCGAWFNNPLMAQQHYEGKKHKRNAARARLLEQLAGSLGATETTAGLRSSYSCSMCNVILNSIEQYHAHLRGSKHQNNLGSLNQTFSCTDSSSNAAVKCAE
ncbi:hypothetical protein Z043_100976 [Scleropages formosus]|uniref:C2H2-type domain-containing protein n=1 Tax=Scleropages formosus TaxID=113540 RepID=A0A0P7VAS5_SCLFO|nr:hypothetical protein Z043_100976 [Scleropages formosus]